MSAAISSIKHRHVPRKVRCCPWSAPLCLDVQTRQFSSDIARALPSQVIWEQHFLKVRRAALCHNESRQCGYRTSLAPPADRRDGWQKMTCLDSKASELRKSNHMQIRFFEVMSQPTPTLEAEFFSRRKNLMWRQSPYLIIHRYQKNNDCHYRAF